MYLNAVADLGDFKVSTEAFENADALINDRCVGDKNLHSLYMLRPFLLVKGLMKHFLLASAGVNF